MKRPVVVAANWKMNKTAFEVASFLDALSPVPGGEGLEVVIAPGSRNAPLSFAVYDAAAAGLLRLHTRHKLSANQTGLCRVAFARLSLRIRQGKPSKTGTTLIRL